MSQRPYCRTCGGDATVAVPVERTLAGSTLSYMDESPTQRMPCPDCEDGRVPPDVEMDAAEYATEDGDR